MFAACKVEVAFLQPEHLHQVTAHALRIAFRRCEAISTVLDSRAGYGHRGQGFLFRCSVLSHFLFCAFDVTFCCCVFGGGDLRANERAQSTGGIMKCHCHMLLSPTLFTNRIATNVGTSWQAAYKSVYGSSPAPAVPLAVYDAFAPPVLLGPAISSYEPAPANEPPCFLKP